VGVAASVGFLRRTFSISSFLQSVGFFPFWCFVCGFGLCIKAQTAAKAWETGHFPGTREGRKRRPRWKKRCTDSPSCNSKEMHWMHIDSLNALCMLSCPDLPRP
jgi:hypothetical protein